MARIEKIIKGEYYHLYNAGNGGQTLFKDDTDRARYLFLITHLQSPVMFNHLSRPLEHFKKGGTFKTSEYTSKAVAKSRYVELVSFSILNDHFHLVIKEMTDGGTSHYMQRVLNAYTKYFNTRYKKRGHLFMGPYKFVIVADQEQLTHLSAHLHMHASTLPDWRGQEAEYPWSSYRDFANNRWGALLTHEHVSERFKNEREYRRFVERPSIKERKRILGHAHLLGEV